MIGVLEAWNAKENRIAARSVVGIAVVLAKAGMEYHTVQDRGIVC